MATLIMATLIMAILIMVILLMAIPIIHQQASSHPALHPFTFSKSRPLFSNILQAIGIIAPIPLVIT